MSTAEISKPRKFRLPVAPQNVFLLLASIFGLAMIFTTPPALVGDEPNHFFRAYQISDGAIIGERMKDGGSGGWIPKNVLDTNRKLVGDIEMNHHIKFDTNLIWELRQLPVDEANKVFVPFHNTVVYAPVPYVPQVIAIYTGKIFNASPIALIYIARVVNLIFFLALAYFAIRITPVFKWVFCFLWLTPTTIFQAASAAADPVMMGSCFLTIAYFLYCALDERKEKISWLDVLKIFVLCVVAALGKQAYILLPFLFLVIPRRKFKSAAVYWATFAALIIVTFGIVGWWAALMKPIFQSYRGDIPVDADAQLSYVLHNPFTFLWVIGNSFARLGGYYFVTFFGGLTWLDLLLPQWLPITLFVIVGAFSLLDKNFDIKISRFNKAVFAAIFVGTVFLISLLLYLSWSPYAGDRVAGIQGRYFIQVAPLLFLLLYNRRYKWKNFERHVPKIIYATVTASLLFTIYSVIMRYYIASPPAA